MCKKDIVLRKRCESGLSLASEFGLSLLPWAGNREQPPSYDTLFLVNVLSGEKRHGEGDLKGQSSAKSGHFLVTI